MSTKVKRIDVFFMSGNIFVYVGKDNKNS